MSRPHTRGLSQNFIRDFALVWAEEGLEAVRKVAKKSPEAFVAIAARICPNDVPLTFEQAIPRRRARPRSPQSCVPVLLERSQAAGAGNDAIRVNGTLRGSH
jgi:hypothetical protein